MSACRTWPTCSLTPSTPIATLPKPSRSTGKDEPSDEEIATAEAELIEAAVRPFDNPELRTKLIEVRRSYEQTHRRGLKGRRRRGRLLASTPPTAPGAPSSRSARSSRSTRTRSPPCRSSTAGRTRSASPSKKSRSWRTPSAGRRIAGRPSSSGRRTRPSTAQGPRVTGPRPDEHRLPRALRTSAGRRTRPVPRPRPASASQPGSLSKRTPGATFTDEQRGVARAHPRPHRRVARDQRRGLRGRAVRPARRAREGV